MNETQENLAFMNKKGKEGCKMLSPSMHLRHFIVCNELVRHSPIESFDAMGIFDRFVAYEYPCVYTFSAAVGLFPAIANHPYQINIIALFNGNMLGEWKFVDAIVYDDNKVLNAVIKTNNFFIPDVGFLAFRVNVDSRNIGEVSFVAEKVSRV
ncbi:MAG: hypothetical protein OWR52_06155 [Acidibacillus sp.]|nr:hypothetical protein [Acidibacillus sp.]